MENNNINKNVAQIILPPDMELRKIKKPKPKTSSEKKETLNKLKQTLKSYDTALSVAASKKINIPAEIGILPDNITQINSIRELRELTSTLQSRIETINQLVAQGGQQQRTAGLFNEGMGGQRLPATPGQFSPQRTTPEILPQTPIFPSPVQPIIPSSADPSQVKDKDAEKTLDKLKQEIMDKLSPEDRAKAEAELEQQQQEQQQQQQKPDSLKPDPETPSRDPLSPERLITDLDLETDRGYPTLRGKKNIEAPRGFTDIYDEFRIYIEGLTQKIIKIDDGVFEMPAFEEQQLNQTRNDIAEKHDRWIKSLNNRQRQYIDNDMVLRQLNQDIIQNTSLDPIDIVKQIAQQQGITINQITSGKTIAEEKASRDEKSKELEQKIKKAYTEFDRITAEANTAGGVNKKSIIDEQVRQTRTILQNITTQYDKLTGPEKVSIESLYQEFRLRSINLQRNIERMKNEDIQIDESGNVINVAPMKAPSEDAPEGRPTPIIIPDPSPPIIIPDPTPTSPPIIPQVPAGEPGGAQPQDDAGPPPLTPTQISDLEPATQEEIRILIDYTNRSGSLNDAEKLAFSRLFQDPALYQKFINYQGKSRKVKEIKKQLKKKFPFITDSDFQSVSSS